MALVVAQAACHYEALEEAQLHPTSWVFRIVLEIMAAQNFERRHELPEKDWNKYEKHMRLTGLGLAQENAISSVAESVHGDDFWHASRRWV